MLNTVPVLPRVPLCSTLTGDNSEPVRLIAPVEMVVRPAQVFAPDSVSVPVPTLISEPPVPPDAPPSLMVPLTVVLRSFPPTVRGFGAESKCPRPRLSRTFGHGYAGQTPTPSGKVPRPDISTMPPALAMNAALPPVLSPKKLVTPPALVVIVESPAVLPWKKFVRPLLKIWALPAVAVPPPKKPGAKLSSPVPSCIVMVA